MVEATAEPSYEKGIIDDHGVLLADKGLRITNLTYRSQGLTDIGGQGLQLENAGIDNHKWMNVEGPISGTLHHFSNHSSFYADSMNHFNLTIGNWTNSANVYLGRESDIFSQDSWNNTGQIFVRGNTSVGSRKKPDALGVVISEGEIKAIIEEALDEAAFKEVFSKAAFFSKKKKVMLDVLRHTDHYLNTITRHHVNGRYTHSTETGYIFQRRTTEKTQKEVELEGEEFPEAVAEAQQNAQGKRDFLKALKQGVKDRLKKLGLLHASRNGIMAALLKGLSEAGLSDEDIREIFGEEEAVNNLLELASVYDQLSAGKIEKLQADLPEVDSFLSSIASQAQRFGLPIWQWAQRNGIEFAEGFCNAAILASRYTQHPAVAVPARVCTLGQLGPRAAKNLEKAQIFFSKKHEGRKEGGAGLQRVVNPPKAESPIWKDLKPHKGSIKTNGKTGKEQQYYRWDYTHNDIEVFDSRMQHIGSMDPATGIIYKPGKGHRPQTD